MNTSSESQPKSDADDAQPGEQPLPAASAATAVRPDERKRLDPTRYGDWEKNGRCIDF